MTTPEVLNEHPSELPDFDRRSSNGIPLKSIGLLGPDLSPYKKDVPTLPTKKVGKAMLPPVGLKDALFLPLLKPLNNGFCCVVQTIVI